MQKNPSLIRKTNIHNLSAWKKSVLHTLSHAVIPIPSKSPRLRRGPPAANGKDASAAAAAAGRARPNLTLDPPVGSERQLAAHVAPSAAFFLFSFVYTRPANSNRIAKKKEVGDDSQLLPASEDLNLFHSGCRAAIEINSVSGGCGMVANFFFFFPFAPACVLLALLLGVFGPMNRNSTSVF